MSEEQEEKNQNVVLFRILSLLTFHASAPYLDFLIKLICKRIRRMQALRIELVAGKFLVRKYQSIVKNSTTHS